MTAPAQRILMLGAVNSPHVVDLALAMREHGFQIDVAGYVSPSVPEIDYAALGIQVHVMPMRALRRGGLPIHVRWIKDLIRELRPAVVHAHSVSFFCWSAALAGARPLISTAWGSDVYHAGALAQRQIRFALKRSAASTADSPELVQRLVGLGAAPATAAVIGWGADLARFAPADGPRDQLKSQLGLGSGPVILSPRSLKPVYNPQVIVAAFAQLRARVPDAQLLLKHLDAAAPALELPATGVTVVGHVPYERMADYYRAADVCVSIPSSDSAPRSVWEAMGCGAPCVLSDLPWVHSMLEPGEDALVVPIEPAAVAAAIERVLGDSELAGRLSARGRGFVAEHEDRAVHMQRLADLYRQVSGT